jgi:hypothetical protein
MHDQSLPDKSGSTNLLTVVVVGFEVIFGPIDDFSMDIFIPSSKNSSDDLPDDCTDDQRVVSF